MKTKFYRTLVARIIQVVALGMVISAALPATAQTIWNGPGTNFTQFLPNPTDQITTNVAITRDSNGPLYNADTESQPDGVTSPQNTLWAFGTITTVNNLSNLTFQTFAAIRNGASQDLADVILNQPMVLEIVDQQIYISIEFTAWGRHQSGGFAYTRSTAPAVTPPTPSVSITNPAASAVFAAPANVKLAANATVSSGTVTNVSFFGNGALLGSVTNSPFKFTSGSLSSGPYALTAVATAAGVSATSAVVNISVVTPVSVTLSSPQVSNSVFGFNYSANSGLSYVVQQSSNLTTWLPLTTNVAAGNPVHFTNSFSSGPAYYRVGRLPNP
jgi:hypothetical protein